MVSFAEYLDHQQENDSNKTTPEDSPPLIFCLGPFPCLEILFQVQGKYLRTNGFLRDLALVMMNPAQ